MIKIHLSLALSRQGGKGDVLSSSHRSCVLWFSIGNRSSIYEYPLLHSIGDHKRVRALKMKLKGSEFASSCYGDDSFCFFTFISSLLHMFLTCLPFIFDEMFAPIILASQSTFFILLPSNFVWSYPCFDSISIHLHINFRLWFNTYTYGSEFVHAYGSLVKLYIFIIYWIQLNPNNDLSNI